MTSVQVIGSSCASWRTFSCKGRGFCPSCLGRRMCATAANLIEHVLPQTADLRRSPHRHVVLLDDAYHEDDAALVWQELGHLKTREVGEVLERAVRRMARYLRRHGAIETAEGDDVDVDPEEKLAASAVSGHAPPAGPQWLRGLVPLSPSALRFDKPLCASLDGFTLHAATRAGALDLAGREALLRYVLRPPIAQERVPSGPDGLVRITLKRPF